MYLGELSSNEDNVSLARFSKVVVFVSKRYDKVIFRIKSYEGTLTF